MNVKKLGIVIALGLTLSAAPVLAQTLTESDVLVLEDRAVDPSYDIADRIRFA